MLALPENTATCAATCRMWERPAPHTACLLACTPTRAITPLSRTAHNQCTITGELKFYSVRNTDENGTVHEGLQAVVETAAGLFVTVTNIEALGPPFPPGWDMGAQVVVAGHTCEGRDCVELDACRQICRGSRAA